MTGMTRLLMGVLVLAGALSIAACDKQDEASSTGNAPATDSTQTGSTGTATGQTETGTTTTQ